MANQEFMNHHSLELLQAALPFMTPSIQKSIEVVSKAEEFMETIRSPNPSSELSAMSLSSDSMNLEDMLLQMKNVGNKKEQESMDNMINFIKMQKMFQSYRTFMSTKQDSDASSGSSKDSMTEFLLSQLTPEQRSNFENINIVLNAMNN
ncbi:MAG: hypothetical protein RSB37_00875 [Acetivibrio sp.]